MEPTAVDLSDPLINHAEGQLFLHEAFKIIVEEVLCKGTDVKEKVSKEKKKHYLYHHLSVYTWWSELIAIICIFLMQVCDWKEPEELALLLDLELREKGEPHEKLLRRVRDVAKYSIKTSKN